MKTLEKIIDVITGEEVIVEREMTDLEIAAIETAKKEQEQYKKNQEARKLLLERLGITEEEAKLLLG